MRIGFGSDHLGFECKEHLKARFARQGHTPEDFSVEDPGWTDYQSATDQLAFSDLQEPHRAWRVDLLQDHRRFRDGESSRGTRGFVPRLELGAALRTTS